MVNVGLALCLVRFASFRVFLYLPLLRKGAGVYLCRFEAVHNYLHASPTEL